MKISGCLVGPLNWNAAKPTIIPMFDVSFVPTESINFNRFGQSQNPILIRQRVSIFVCEKSPSELTRFTNQSWFSKIKKEENIRTNKSEIMRWSNSDTGSSLHCLSGIYIRDVRENWNRSSRFWFADNKLVSYGIHFNTREKSNFLVFASVFTENMYIGHVTHKIWNARAYLEL